MISFELGGARETGELLKVNHYTIWVRLAAKANELKGRIIKRHMVKHQVSAT